MKIITVHGIHTAEGHNSMAALRPILARHLPDQTIVGHDYGFMGFWQARWRNGGEAARLADVIEDGDIVVTHSNGAALAYLAVRDYGARPVGIININPALDRWRTAGVEWVETIHSDGDRWVWLSQWLPGHIWGDQGRVGYRGTEDNTVSHNASDFGGRMVYSDHCGLFDPQRIDRWSAFIAHRIGERLDEAAALGLEAQRLHDIYAGWVDRRHGIADSVQRKASA